MTRSGRDRVGTSIAPSDGEACFIERGGETFDVALVSRVPEVVLVSTAAPSWLRRITRNAVPVPER